MIKTVFAVYFLSCFLYAQLKGPEIYLPVDMYDFGTVQQGTVIKHSFAIVNKGDDTLKIANLMTSCGCTAADLETKILLPGQSVKASLEFNTAGRVGAQTKYISIASNDKNHPQMKFTLRGNIVIADTGKKAEVINGPKIYFPEKQHDFGLVEEGKIYEYTFRFSNTGNSDLEIKDLKTSCGCTAALLSSKTIKPGGEGTLKIELDTSNRFGRMSRNITLTTNEPDGEIKVLTIYAEVKKKEN